MYHIDYLKKISFSNKNLIQMKRKQTNFDILQRFNFFFVFLNKI